MDNEERSTESQGEGHGAAGTALKAAVAAAATGAAAVAAKKALTRDDANGVGGSSRRSSSPGSTVSSVVSAGWEAARDALVPLAEDAAAAAGAYLAEKGPDVVRDRIVPRFISSFDEARG
jgi:hypothetical protein